MNLFSFPFAKRAFLGALPALLTACSGVGLLNATVPTDDYRRTEGLAYGPDPRQRLDVYQPLASAPGAPMVVFFYGGSWSSGERADYRFVGEALASRGIVVVVADYRLSPAVRYPVFVRDSASAVRWAFDHAADFGADARRVFVMGHSAGAYNAAMLVLDPRWLAAEGLSPARLAGWIGLAGPYDFLPISDAKTKVAFSWPDTPADSQPLAYAAEASPTSPPALLLAPAEDHTVNPQRSTVALARALKDRGVKVQSSLFDGVGHVSLLVALAPLFRSRAPVLERTISFIRSAD